MSKTRAIAPLSNMSSTSWTSSASRKNRRRPFPEVWQALEDKEDETQEEEIKQRVHASRKATTRQHHHHQQHQQRDDDDGDDNASDDEYANEVKEEDDEDDEEQKGDSEASRPSDSSSLALISGGSGGGDSSRSHRPTKRHRPRRRFSHIKSDILGSKTLVRRAQEEARLRSSRSSASKWQRLLEGVCGGAGTLGTLASVGLMARKTTGASTAFVALSALASFSFVWRGAVRRRGEEAERRLSQLAALEDDPGRISRLLDLVDADPHAFFQNDEVLSLLSRPRGELVIFREETLVEEALEGKMASAGSTAFLRQPHLQAITSRLRRAYPRLAQAMDRWLLVELEDEYSPRALSLKDLLAILSSWQWEVLISDREPLRRQLEESLRRALHAPQGQGPKGDLVESLLLIDSHTDARSLSLLKTRLPRAFAAYQRGEERLAHALSIWEGGSLSSFLETYPSSLLLRRIKGPLSFSLSRSSSATPSSSSFSSPSPPSSPFVIPMRRLWQQELKAALTHMHTSHKHKSRGRRGVGAGGGGEGGGVSKCSSGGGSSNSNSNGRGSSNSSKALDSLLDGLAWRLISTHRPSLDFLLLPPSLLPSLPLPLPRPSLLHSLTSRRAALARAASQDKERAEAASARKMREETLKLSSKLASLKVELAHVTAEETHALAPLLAEKDRVWAAINGGSITSEDSIPPPAASPLPSSLQAKIAALDEARAQIRQVQDRAAEKRGKIEERMEATREEGEKAVRIAREMGLAKAAVSEGMLHVGTEALARELLQAVGLMEAEGVEATNR